MQQFPSIFTGICPDFSGHSSFLCNVYTVAYTHLAAILNELRRDAMALSPLSKARMLSLRLSWSELLRMYYKYIGCLLYTSMR